MDQAASLARRFLAQEAQGLLSRLARLKAFSLAFPMLPAANISAKAANGIETLLAEGQRTLRLEITSFLTWLGTSRAAQSDTSLAQSRFTALKLHFNDVVSHVDIFTDVLAQRGEHEMGTFVAGLDEVAADALDLGGTAFAAPPLVCYLDRGHGAAIRRARTRLPGGAQNPVAVIRMPRERMIGCGIAGSLVHEVGHQGAALLELVPSLKAAIDARLKAEPSARLAWTYWQRCISEMIADLWSVARVGVTATAGLMAVVSLPRAFVFRLDLEDPHPAPWLRVQLSAALGAGLFPHPQWAKLRAVWERLYPLSGAPDKAQPLLRMLATHIPAIVSLMLSHRPAKLGGANIGQGLRNPECTASALARTFSLLRTDSLHVQRTRPCVAFAALGQARIDGRIDAAEESTLLSRLLTHWALSAALRSVRRHDRRVVAPAKQRVLPPTERIDDSSTLASQGGIHVFAN